MTIDSISSSSLIQQNGTKSENVIKENNTTDKSDSSITLESSTSILEEDVKEHSEIDSGDSEATAQGGEPGSLLDILA